MSQMVAIQDLPLADELQVGTKLLYGQYQIECQLQRGGFGITYIARDSLDRQVVIKECFPSEICQRTDGLVHAVAAEFDDQLASIKRQFVREAHRMAKLRHPHIVEVHQVFEENNSAYMALEQVVGVDLITVHEEQPERLTAKFLEASLRQALEAIRYTHCHGMLHRDISPDNILVDDSDHLTLIDFGAAREHTVKGNRAHSALIAVKDGYSPHEFYLPDVMHDYSSDLYSLGATFYHLIAGSPPPHSQVRLSAVSAGADDPYVPLALGDWNCDYNVLLTVDRAMEVLQEKRYQTSEEWLTGLDNTPRDRPARPVAPVADPQLETKISQFVQQTNTQFEAFLPALARPDANGKKSRPGTLAVETQRRQWVDIFGDPIEDVSAWLNEQERENQAKQISARKKTTIVGHAKPGFARRSLFASLFSRRASNDSVSVQA